MIFANRVQPEKLIFDEAVSDEGVVTRTIWEGPEDLSKLNVAGPTTDFAEAIVHHRPPMTGLEQSLVIQKITDAIYDSSERGTAVDID
jgi:predicted dehydrogenase